MREIGQGAEQGLAVLAGQDGGAPGGGRLVAQHHAVGAVDMIGGGERGAEILEQAPFQRRREVGLSPDLARQFIRLAAPPFLIAKEIGESDLARNGDRGKFREIGGDALGLGAFDAGEVFRMAAHGIERPVGMGAHEAGDALHPRLDRMIAQKFPFHGSAHQGIMGRQRRVALFGLAFVIEFQGHGGAGKVVAEFFRAGGGFRRGDRRHCDRRRILGARRDRREAGAAGEKPRLLRNP